MSEPTGHSPGGPLNKRDAAFRVLLGEMADLFAKVDSLTAHVQTADKNMKDTARLVHEAAQTAKRALAAMPEKPVEMIEPLKPARPLALVPVVVAGLVSGLAAGAVVAGSIWLSDQEPARIGRAVMAAYPTLDQATQAKVQAAINKAPR